MLDHNMGDNCTDILNEVLEGYSHEIVKQYSLCKAYLVRFDSLNKPFSNNCSAATQVINFEHEYIL